MLIKTIVCTHARTNVFMSHKDLNYLSDMLKQTFSKSKKD